MNNQLHLDGDTLQKKISSLNRKETQIDLFSLLHLYSYSVFLRDIVHCTEKKKFFFFLFIKFNCFIFKQMLHFYFVFHLFNISVLVSIVHIYVYYKYKQNKIAKKKCHVFLSK